MTNIAVHTIKSKESKFQMTKKQVSKGYEEARGLTAATLKLGTIVAPAGVSLELGIRELTAEQIVAVVALAISFAFGLFWLRQN